MISLYLKRKGHVSRGGLVLRSGWGAPASVTAHQALFQASAWGVRLCSFTLHASHHCSHLNLSRWALLSRLSWLLLPSVEERGHTKALSGLGRCFCEWRRSCWRTSFGCCWASGNVLCRRLQLQYKHSHTEAPADFWDSGEFIFFELRRTQMIFEMKSQQIRLIQKIGRHSEDLTLASEQGCIFFPKNLK